MNDFDRSEEPTVPNGYLLTTRWSRARLWAATLLRRLANWMHAR